MARELAPNVMVPYEVARQQQLAEEIAEREKNPLSTTVPGGRYEGPDGELHDAEGRPLKKGKAAEAEEEDDKPSKRSGSRK